MQSEQTSEVVKITLALLDLGLITCAFYLAILLRFGTFELAENFIWLYYISTPMVLFLMLRHGVLTGYRYQRLRDIFKSTLFSFLVTGVACTALLYLSKAGEFSRLVFGFYFALSTIFVLTEKVLVKKLYDRYLIRGGLNVRVALIGYGSKFDQILRELIERPQLGLAPVLVHDPRETDIHSTVARIRNAVIDEVYVIYPRCSTYHDQVDELLARLEKLGLPVKVALNFDELDHYYSQHICAMGSGNIGVLLAPFNLDPDQLLIKRVMDLIGSFLGLMITAALYPILALAIKMDSPGPAIFSQERVGKGGRKFTIYKFRSMQFDAETKKKELIEDNLYQGALFKVVDDPRITTVGKFIRKYSLDEFPQFWNVLKGEMSLVGTRPPTLDEVSQYQDHHFRRISIKPGLTGLWQVSGRNKITDFDEVVKLDVEYIRNWNFWLDIRIIWRTLLIFLYPKAGSTGI